MHCNASSRGLQTQTCQARAQKFLWATLTHSCLGLCRSCGQCVLVQVPTAHHLKHFWSWLWRIPNLCADVTVEIHGRSAANPQMWETLGRLDSTAAMHCNVLRCLWTAGCKRRQTCDTSRHDASPLSSDPPIAWEQPHTCVFEMVLFCPKTSFRPFLAKRWFWRCFWQSAAAKISKQKAKMPDHVTRWATAMSMTTFILNKASFFPKVKNPVSLLSNGGKKCDIEDPNVAASICCYSSWNSQIFLAKIEKRWGKNKEDLAEHSWNWQQKARKTEEFWGTLQGPFVPLWSWNMQTM